MALVSWSSHNPATVAHRGLARMGKHSALVHDSWREGHRALEKLADTVTVAAVADKIASASTLTGAAAVACQKAALKAIEGGLDGPIGPMLAAVALEALKGAATPADQLELGRTFLTEIADRGSAGAGAVAEAARQAGPSIGPQTPGLPQADLGPAIAAHETALQMIREARFDGSRGRALARFGERFNQRTHLGMPAYIQVNDRVLSGMSGDSAAKVRDDCNRRWSPVESVSLEYDPDGYVEALRAAQGDILEMQRAFFRDQA